MAKRQVAYAAARWTTDEGHVLVGLRGEVHDIPDSEIERLEAQGALVPADAELFKPGVLLELDEEASDEKIRNYLLSGNVNEILTQAAGYPTSLVEKLLVAEREGLARPALVDRLENRVGSLALPGTPAPEFISPPEDPAVTAGAVSTDGDDLAGFVEASNVPAIMERVGDDHDLAQQVLAIETAGKNRKSLVDELTKLTES